MKNWTHISQLFLKVKNRFSGELGSGSMFDAFSRLIPYGRPVFFNKKTGELLVEVSSNAGAQNLQFRQETLIYEMNKRLGRPIIKRLRFRPTAK